ncbi:asparagine synthase-related protein [Gemmobacter sp.]|uniref:asparagine synthase-related protein n=1 Tax=Gemmobacter sp. TaxID=1898957 RepID=UPI002AFFC6BF|nr:asparagine synthase-related protein [Gemmobacter sp.]
MTALALVLHLDGRKAAPGDLARMLAEMARRGPEGEAVACDGPVALGARLLATTPEALVEPMPYHHAASGCRITGQIRLDNRAELLARFGLAQAGRVVGDGELVVRAWLDRGEDCASHLLGDFAFAIWDPRRACVFAARDQLGMRQLIYAHRPGQAFFCASSARAVGLAVEAPLNETRLAEALIDFEWGSLTSTFFEAVFRLPPAHCLTVDASGLRLREYWRMTPPEPLRLKSDAEYAEAFREVLGQSVRDRLRVAGRVGSMLSGGMDSGAVVALACRMTGTPLPVFSSVGPDPATCVETRAIHAALAMPNVDPTLICHSDLAPWAEDLIAAWKALEEPWDFHMTVPRAAYLAAQRAGVSVVLDGVAGDVLLGHGSQMARHIRAGRLRQALGDARGLTAFYGMSRRHTASQLILALRGAFMPDALRALRHAWRQRRPVSLPVDSAVDMGFARRAGLFDSLRSFELGDRPRRMGFAEERIWSWPRSGLNVGRERYDRVASHFGVEPRDPYMDRRVVDFCLSLPFDQFQEDGWPKIIQRRAMAGLLPDAVCWRRGKQHLGMAFTQALMDHWPDWAAAIPATRAGLAGRVAADLVRDASLRRNAEGHLHPRVDLLLQMALFTAKLSPNLRQDRHAP